MQYMFLSFSVSLLAGRHPSLCSMLMLQKSVALVCYSRCVASYQSMRGPQLAGHGVDGKQRGSTAAVEGVQGWQEITDRARAEDEEHNIKLVYVCRELWRRYGHWRGFRAAAETFIATPSIGPGH